MVVDSNRMRLDWQGTKGEAAIGASGKNERRFDGDPMRKDSMWQPVTYEPRQ